uniref:Uncharacterized protein n=1 Tax=Steinernema glaseri TaxID=37863 RepID=A0A1I7ZLS5_9BILA
MSDAPVPEKKDSTSRKEATMEVDGTAATTCQEAWWLELIPEEKPKTPAPSPAPITETFFDDIHVYPLPRERFVKDFFFGSVKVHNSTERDGTKRTRVDILDRITCQSTSFMIDDWIHDVVFCEGRQEFYFSGMKQTIYCYFYVADDTELRDDYLIIRRQYSRACDGKWSYVPVLLDNAITKSWLSEDPTYSCIEGPRRPQFEKCRNAAVVIAANTDDVVYVINSHLEREGCSVFRNNEHIADLDTKVVLMEAGTSHTLLLTQNCQLYAMGASLLSDCLDKLSLRIELDVRLDMHIYDGEAVGFGWNSNAQLGPEIPVGDIVATPAPMMPIEDRHFWVSAFACDTFTALLSSKGEVVEFPKDRQAAECI